MQTMVFYAWQCYDEGGEGVCYKENFSTHISDITRVILFEFNSKDEFIKNYLELYPDEDPDSVKRIAEYYCKKLNIFTKEGD